ncbi:MAG: pantetheine-phosphate adenylyltransferase [Eubacteriales bacterium]|jgi:pantetheine-phosphate adenylyltransferase
MRIAIYPGSFDPVNTGHLDIIKRAARLFDKLYVAVMVNVEKKTSFTWQERVDLLNRVVSGFSNVEVVSDGGLLAQFASSLGAKTIVKGIRNLSDFEAEHQMALINASLNHELDTVLLPADSRYMHVSSTAVRAVAAMGGDLTGLVPAEIIPDIKEKLCR